MTSTHLPPIFKMGFYTTVRDIFSGILRRLEHYWVVTEAGHSFSGSLIHPSGRARIVQSWSAPKTLVSSIKGFQNALISISNLAVIGFEI